MKKSSKTRRRNWVMTVAISTTLVATAALSTNGPYQVPTAFGRKYYSCDVWTDWQSICTRTGKGGAIVCRQDPHVKVMPSEAFCVTGVWTDKPWYVTDTPGQRRSRLRFCAARDVEQYGTDKVPVCREYASDRPFNGTHIDTQNSTECDVVRVESSSTDLCRNDGKPGAPRCQDIQNLFRAKQPLYCAKWKENSQCLASDRPNLQLATSDIVLTPPIRSLTGRVVWAPFCAREKLGDHQ
jgi:hypothetical protein